MKKELPNKLNDLNDLNDEDLMLQYRDGEAAAFDVLYARHKGGLYRYFLRQLNNQPELANELFQDVWMKLIKARSTYQFQENQGAKFTTWFYRLAHNHLIDYWRREKGSMQRVEFVESDEAQAETASNTSRAVEPQQTLQQDQLRKQIKQAIASLPEEQRSAFLLKEDAALSLAQIADVTGVNRETVKSRLRYGVKRLQGILHPLRSVS